MRIFWALVMAVATGFAAVGTGNAKILDCSFPILSSNQGWLSDRYILNYDEKAGTADVIDGLIQDLKGKPIAAKVRVVSAKQTAFSWTLQTTDTRGQLATKLFRATLFPADNTIIMTAVPVGYVNRYESRGTCKVK